MQEIHIFFLGVVYMPVIPALRRLRQEDHIASLGYIVSSRPVWTT
jgi:hypothetical protein